MRTDTPKGFAVTPAQEDIDHGSDTPDHGEPHWSTKVGSEAWNEIGRGPGPLDTAEYSEFGTAVQTALAKDTIKNFGAAFRQGNTIWANTVSTLAGTDNQPEPGFSPWDVIKGTPYEANWESFVDVRNTKRAEATKRQIDQEKADKRLLDASPWYISVPAQLVAGVADWPTLLPGGAFVRGAKGGFSMVKSAAVVGGAAGLSAGAQEATLHSLQETRTLGESAGNIGASVFLGGLLGAAGAKLMNHAEWRQAVDAINHDLAGSGPAPELTSAIARGV